MTRRIDEKGASHTWMILGISFIGVSLIAGTAAVWALMNYIDQKNNFDTTTAAAVSLAQKEQADADEAKFAEREKSPNRQFAGPDDYGRLTFDYPKTWSVYVNEDGSGNGDTYEAYLNPVTVPPVNDDTRYALRVVIEQVDFDEAISDYDKDVEEGNLKSSSVTINGTGATRLDGQFTDDIRGSAVIFKIRDKTVTIRSDADTFKEDFNKIIGTIDYNS
jgi:hypothetical protein